MAAGPVTLITGAGSGIGRALAIMLAQRHHRLVLAGRTHTKLQETERLCAAAAPASAAITVECDISDTAQASALADRALVDFQDLDVLVNCAGVAPLEPIASTSPEMLQHVFRCNAFGPAALISRAWPHFLSRGSGCIVNVSSLATHDPFPGFFAYAASKSALDSFTRSCHIEGEAHGIRAFTVNPGAVETPLLRGLFSHEQLPPERVLHPQEVASLIVECIEGQRERDRGKVIHVVRE